MAFSVKFYIAQLLCQSLWFFFLGTTEDKKDPSTRVLNVAQCAISPQLMQNPTPITGCLAPTLSAVAPGE